MLKNLYKWVVKYYEDSDYCCPECGKSSSDCEMTDWYSYICPDCNIEFETPDT